MLTRIHGLSTLLLCLATSFLAFPHPATAKEISRCGLENRPSNFRKQTGASDKPPCATWKGRRARITFHSLPAGEFEGELSAIYFF